MIYAQPGAEGSVVSFKSRYGNYINGEFVAPVKGQYFTNLTPVTGNAVCEIPRSTAEDIDKALDAAHAAKDAWGKTSVQARSNILLKIADRIEQNLEMLAVTETWDNGKAVRETLNADIPLAARCVEQGARVLRHNGEAFNEKNIGQQLAMRDLMADMRAANPLGQGGGPVVLLPAIKPDVTVFHSPRADTEGNVWIGRRRELVTMAHAAAATLVTVEAVEDKDFLDDEATAAGTLSGLYVTAIAVAEGGARPLGLTGHYERDTDYIRAYAEEAKTGDGFKRYLDREVFAETGDETETETGAETGTETGAGS